MRDDKHLFFLTSLYGKFYRVTIALRDVAYEYSVGCQPYINNYDCIGHVTDSWGFPCVLKIPEFSVFFM